mgnify:CR=1 FL=1
MNRIKSIRHKLGLTQVVLAEVLGCTQGNISFYEGDQTMPPETAKKLIAYAASVGVEIDYADVYGPAVAAA